MYFIGLSSTADERTFDGYSGIVKFSDQEDAYMYRIVHDQHGLDHARIVQKWTNGMIRYRQKRASGGEAILVTKFLSARCVDPQSQVIRFAASFDVQRQQKK